MRALIAIVVAFAALPVAAADARWPSFPGKAGGIFRSGELVRGQWIYTNGIGQALGADADDTPRTEYFAAAKAGPGEADQGFMRRDLYLALTYDFFGAHRGAHNGDLQLPKDGARYPAGTADLAELRMRADSRYAYVRFRWESLPDRTAQVATLAFAAERADPPVREWPRNARLASGYDAAITAWGAGAVLSDPDGSETKLKTRRADHAIVVRVPLARLPAGPWRLTGGSGLGDPDAPGNYWDVPPGDATQDTPGSGGDAAPTNVAGLLFADDDSWSFDELAQSRLLSGGDASAAAVTVDPRALTRGRTRRAAPRTGDLSRMFFSRREGEDGIRRETGLTGERPPVAFGAAANPDFDVAFKYTGRLQWYGMHVPERYPATREAWPLIVYLHGYTGLPDEAFHNPVGLVEQADERGYLVATPLGRGDYFYEGPGDLDVLEVIRDVERHYRVDRSRIYLMGHSMGGYGTNNVATRHPDLFAAVAPAQGTGSIELAGNLRHVPWFEASSEQDLDAGAADARRLYAALSERGYDAKLLVYATKIHEYSSIYDNLEGLFAFFAEHRLVRAPADITWVRPPKAADRRKLGLVYDGAYWLDRVRAADPAALAEVTVTSSGRPHRPLDPASAARSEEAVDTHGPTGRSAGNLLTTRPAFGPRTRRRNRLDIVAENTRALSVDLRAARLRAKGLRIVSDSETPLKITLLRRGSRRSTTVDLAAGKQTVVVRDARRR